MKIQHFVRHRCIYILIIIAAGFSLSSCVSIIGIPSNSGEDSLLLIPLEKDYEEEIYHYGFRYEIYIKELKKTIYIRPEERYYFHKLKPGTYHITEFRTIRIYDGKISGKEEFSLPIKMKVGKITFLPFKIQVKMLPGEDSHHFYQQTGFEKTTLKDKRRIYEEIKEYNNFDQWQFTFKE